MSREVLEWTTPTEPVKTDYQQVVISTDKMPQETLSIVVILCLAKSSLACYGATLLKSGGLSCYDKRQIVAEHNRLRQLTALGQVQGQPPAANMLEMGWDEELAQKAQAWANNCRFEHDSIWTRRVSRFGVGQNLAVTWSSPRPDNLGPEPDFLTQINSWFNEVYTVGYRGVFSHASGHFSQLVWGNSYLVGCGYSHYYRNNRYYKLYVCNYGPGGNVLREAPYAVGGPSCEVYGTTPSRNYFGLCAPRDFLIDPCYWHK